MNELVGEMQHFRSAVSNVLGVADWNSNIARAI